MLLVPLRKYSPKLDTPYLTVVLVAVNSAVYLYTLLLAGREQITISYGFTPAQPEPLTWLTHMFIRDSILHLMGNRFFLYHTHSGVLIDVLSLRGLFFGPRIIDARFSPDERFVVTRSADRSIYLWGVAH